MVRRREALAAFGDYLLDHDDLDDILDAGCRIIAQALDVDLTAVIEIGRDAGIGVVRAGIGWRPGLAGRARIDLTGRSAEAFAIAGTEPLIIADIADDTRFAFPPYLRDHGAVALVAVPILLPGRRPWGVLQVAAGRARDFDPEDIAFLRTCAMVLGPVIDRIRTVAEREEARRDLSDREGRLRTVLEGIDEPFYALDRDYRFLFVSQAALDLWRRDAGAVLGHSFRDVFPQADGSEPYEAHRRVMRTGVAERLETISPVVGRWVEIYLAPTPQGGLSVAFRDIETRKQADRRQAFLLKLSDALRPLASSAEMERVATRVLGEELGADRAFFATVEDDDRSWSIRQDYTGGRPSLAGRYPMARLREDYLAGWQAGRMSSVADIRTDPALSDSDRAAYAAFGARAAIGVPLVKGGRFAALLAVNQAEPRHWTEGELALTREAADRIWAELERARAEEALRDSEERFRALVTAGNNSVYRMSPDWRTMYQLDSHSLAVTSDPIEDWADKYILEDDRPRVDAAIREAIRTRSLFELEHRVQLANGDIGWVLSRAVPLLGPAGEIIEWFGAGSDVTARRAAVEGLCEREADLARVQRIGGVGGLDIDVADETTSRRSPEYLRLHGLPPETVQESHADWRARVHPDDVAAAERTLAAALQGDARSYESEYRIVRPSDGAVRWIAARADIERDGTGQATRLVGAHIDVTEQKRVQEALRESEERLRQFGEASQDVLWIRDAGTMEWTYLTRAFEDIYGLSRDEALRGDNFRNWLELIVPEDRDHARRMIGRVVEGEPVKFEYRIRRPHDGEIRWLRNTDFPIRDEHGNNASFGGIGQDITSIKAAEERLTASEEWLRSATEVARFALWDWNMRTDEVAWSDEHFRMEGYAVDEIVPSYAAWAARVHPDDRPGTEAAMARARDTHTEYVHEFRSVHPDGSVHWLSARGRFFYDAAGAPIRMVGAMLETTERREWEGRQKVLLAELQHRVRNILAVIRSIVSRSDDGERSTEDYVQHLQGRISALARTQVLLTRSAGAGVDLEDMIRDELVAQVAREEQFSLAGPDVELSPKAAEVLTLAIHELATNATKYGAFSRATGRLHVEWDVALRDGQKWLVLTWKERGVPIVDAAPRRQGFGSELISRRIPYELRGTGSFGLKAGGMESHIEFPLRSGDSVLQTGGVG